MAADLLTNYTKNAKQKFEFYKYADTLNLAYKFNIGKTFTNIYIIPEEKKIVYEDKDCPICKNVKLPRKLKGIMYCNFIAGIFAELTKQGGYNTTCKEVKCKASGDDTCTYELTLTE
jgi:predicted hydrocarbon binding protein